MNRLFSALTAATFALGLPSAYSLTSTPDPIANVPAPTGAGGAPFPAVSNFADAGPYAVAEFSSDNCTFYYPSNPGAGGVRHPVVLWGNGTGATTAIYYSLLPHFASHGFVLAAAKTTMSGTGEAIISCLDEAAVLNADSSSPLYQKLNTTRVGVSGHSQGGGGTLMAARDRRITASAPIQPYILGLGHDQASLTQQNGAMLLLAGTADALVDPALNQDKVFEVTNVPVFYANQEGTTHFAPLINGGDYRAPVTAWFRYYLMDDQNAKSMFFGNDCELCQNPEWIIQKKALD